MIVQEKEAIIREIDELPTDLLQEVLDFVRFLKSQAMKKQLETAILSEPVLGRDWLRPEEEEAWKDL
jgi:hypothetical protein